MIEALARHWPRAIAYVWFPTLYLVTLSAQPDRPWLGVEPFELCVLCGDRGVADFILNVALFVPFGLLATRRLGLVRTVLVGIGISTGIELWQLTIPGRFSTLGDIVANGTGTLLGSGLYRGLGALVAGARPRPALGLVAAGLTGGVVLVGGWLLAPDPTDDGYWGQWTPFLGSGTRYAGSVLEAHLDDRPFPNGRLAEDRDARGALLRDWRLTGLIEAGPPAPAVTSLLSIYDDSSREVLYLGTFDEHLLLRERIRAVDWGLDTPELTAFGILSDIGIGDTVRVTALRDGNDRCLVANGREVCGLELTPGRLWSLLMQPSRASAYTRQLADRVLMFVLFLPLGLLSTGWRSASMNAAVAGVVIAVATLLTRLTMGPVAEALCALAGLAVGYGSAAGLRWFGLRLSGPGSEPDDVHELA